MAKVGVRPQKKLKTLFIFLLIRRVNFIWKLNIDMQYLQGVIKQLQSRLLQFGQQKTSVPIAIKGFRGFLVQSHFAFCVLVLDSLRIFD